MDGGEWLAGRLRQRHGGSSLEFLYRHYGVAFMMCFFLRGRSGAASSPGQVSGGRDDRKMTCDGGPIELGFIGGGISL
jgi:hypothetical protein